MLETLLESRSTKRSSPAGTFISVTAHTAMIAAALYATAQARVATIQSPTVVRPVYVPPAPPAVRANAATRVTAPAIAKRLVFVPTVKVDLSRALDLSA